MFSSQLIWRELESCRNRSKEHQTGYPHWPSLSSIDETLLTSEQAVARSLLAAAVRTELSDWARVACLAHSLAIPARLGEERSHGCNYNVACLVAVSRLSSAELGEEWARLSRGLLLRFVAAVSGRDAPCLVYRWVGSYSFHITANIRLFAPLHTRG